ncbi:MAG: protein kinase [Acidobacteria bacterium]|nr:protein kinase [Acidobacteriota bacterium]
MPPTTVSHFELLEKLGEGGMGAVYRARDRKLNRIVALKFLSPKLIGSAEQQERFKREALIISSLSHPHVATVFEVDEIDGKPFLALEFLGGGTLQSRIRAHGGHLSVSSVVAWAIGLAEGLEHAHRHSVIHRDVKSSNAMFDAEGRIKLTDFGLAQSPEEARSQAPGKIEGTIGYLPPEQWEGAPPDTRGDLFSFGVLLFEMATGALPFPGKDLQEIIGKLLSADPPPLSSFRADLPVALQAIVSRLLQKKPENRFPSAHQVARALRALHIPSADSLPTQSIALSPPPVPPFNRRWFALAALPIVGGAGWTYAETLRRWIASSRLPDRKHVAVLPFRSIGGDPGQQAFCDGLTETLTTALTKHGGFSVVPSADARKLQSSGDARREFGVNLVIASSIQRRGDEFRVILTLIDAVSLRQIDAETIDWPVRTLHEMEDSVIARISNLLNVAATQPVNPLLAGASQLPSAYDAYLRGRGFLYRLDKAGNFDRAKQQFQAAIQADPRFALAHIALAETNLGLYRVRRDPSDLAAAQSAADQAIQLKSSLAGGHIVLGAILAELNSPEKATAELELALKLDPRDPSGYRELARLYRSQKRHREAEQTYQRAIAMRPTDWMGYSNLGFYYLTRQRQAEAEVELRKVIELTPDNHLGYRNLGTALLGAGKDPAQAEAMMRKAVELNPGGRNYNNLGALLIFYQRYREAVPVMEKAVQLAAEEGANDYKALGNLGDAYWLSGHVPERSRQAWQQALAIVQKRSSAKPTDAELLVTQALYQSKVGDTAAATAAIAKAVLLAPESATVHYIAALAYATAKLDPLALDEIRTAARQGYSRDEIRRAPEFSRYQELPAFEQALNPPASPNRR